MADLTKGADTDINPELMFKDDSGANQALDDYDNSASQSNQKQKGFDVGDLEKVAEVALLL